MGTTNNSERKPCPLCAELILADAKKCRFCGSMLEKDWSRSLNKQDTEIIADSEQDLKSKVEQGKGNLKKTHKELLIVGMVLLPIIFAWFTLDKKNWSKKARISAFIWAAIAMLFSLGNGEPTSGSKSFSSTEKTIDPEELSVSQQKKVCETYIAKLMGKNRAIMRSELLKEEYGNSFIKVYYTRSSDSSKWETLCTYQKDHLLWASLENGIPGRWRYEDEGKLKGKGSSIIISVPKLGVSLVNF